MTRLSDQDRDRDRAKAALGVVILHGLLGYAFVTGLGFEVAERVAGTLKVFDVPAAMPPPAPDPLPDAMRTPKPEGAAAAPNLPANAAPIVAPRPAVVLPISPPVVVAPVAAAGRDASAGASDRPGLGSGAGGEGNGTGSGRFGNGAGGGGGVAIRARQIAGRIEDRDYPRDASKAGAQGVVVVRFTVATDGRAGGCAVMRSSGSADLDSTTCRLIERRFRFTPARDAGGRAVPELRGWRQDWWFEPR